jgi:hypothetical protein
MELGQSLWLAKVTISTLAAAIFLVACETPTTRLGPPHPIKTGPGSLAITVADLPQGWIVDSTVTGSITSPRFGDSANDTAYRSNGWSSAYEADFTYTGDNAMRIAVLIHQFNDPAGAKSFFAAGIGAQRGQHGQDLSHPPALGQDSYAFTQHFTGKATQFWFYWIDRNTLIRMLVSGPDGAITEAAATDLAHRQARIVQRA